MLQQDRKLAAPPGPKALKSSFGSAVKPVRAVSLCYLRLSCNYSGTVKVNPKHADCNKMFNLGEIKIAGAANPRTFTTLTHPVLGWWKLSDPLCIVTDRDNLQADWLHIPGHTPNIDAEKSNISLCLPTSRFIQHLKMSYRESCAFLPPDGGGCGHRMSNNEKDTPILSIHLHIYSRRGGFFTSLKAEKNNTAQINA